MFSSKTARLFKIFNIRSFFVGWKQCLPLLVEFLIKKLGELVDHYALLSHGVAAPDRHRTIRKTIEVDSDTEGSANLVLSKVAFADIASFVDGNAELTSKSVGYLTGFVEEFVFVPEKWKNGDLIGREPVWKLHYNPVLLGVFEISIHENNGEEAREPKCGFDNVRNKFFLGVGVGVAKIDSGFFDMILKIEVGTIGQTKHFFETPGEFVFEIFGT